MNERYRSVSRETIANPPAIRDRILECADGMGVAMDLWQADKLALHLALVLKAGAHINLTAIADLDMAISLHVLDSWAVLSEIQDAPTGPVADMGSGQGYPGIPIALGTKRHVCLIEATGKKADFIQEVIGALELRRTVTVVNSRIEQIGAEHIGRYSVVTARALAKMPSLLELATPLLEYGGRVVAMKGFPDETEIRQAHAAARVLGLTFQSMREFTLPLSGQRRTCLVWVRSAPASVAVPRAVGKAQRKPLGGT